MATIRIELYKGKTLSDGRHPVCVTVSHNGLIKRKSITSAFINEWGKDGKLKKSRPESARLNLEIEDAFEKYWNNFKRLRDGSRVWKADEVFKERDKEYGSMFKDNVGEYLKTIKNRNTKKAREQVYEKVLRYTKDQDFSLEDIDEKWMRGFIRHCKTNEKDKLGNIGNADNTITYAVKFIKTIANFADVENKTLKKTKVSYKDADLDYPTLEDYNNMWKLELKPYSAIWNARNFFSLQILFWGMRSGDLQQLEWTDIIDNKRLHYDSTKTGHEYKIDLMPKAIEILTYYKDSGRKYVFPYFTWYYRPELSKEENEEAKGAMIDSGTAVINKYLREIGKKASIKAHMSTHKARHMFAIWSDQTLGGDIGIIQKMMGHGTRAMTEKYIKRLRKTSELNEAASKVLKDL